MVQEEIKKNPYKFIIDWAESNLLYVGGQVFKYLALQPCSIIIPDIPFSGTNIRSNFNILYIAPPSSGKSTICEIYEKISFFPYNIKKATETKLSTDLARLKEFSLILQDFSQIGDNYDVIKVLEGALGDEKSVLKRTKYEEIEVKVNGTGLLCGTWTDLGRYLEYFRSGLLFRCVMLFVNLNDQQLTEIGRYINDGVGNKDISAKSNKKEEIVKAFYKELQDIQQGNHKEIDPIIEYDFSNPLLKNRIFSAWEQKVSQEKKHFEEKFKMRFEYSFARELHEGYRFLCASAFLNIFNREVKEGILTPNEEDCNLAINLMGENLRNKIKLLESRQFLAMIKNSSFKLQSLLGSERISPETKKMLISLSNARVK